MKNRYYFSKLPIVAILLIAVLSPFNLIAQDNGQVSGTVYETSTSSALPGANIVIEGTSRGEASDRNGFFLISKLAPGTYSVKASFLGYEDVIQ